jgi:hypothetical protein
MLKFFTGKDKTVLAWCSGLCIVLWKSCHYANYNKMQTNPPILVQCTIYSMSASQKLIISILKTEPFNDRHQMHGHWKVLLE